MTQTDSVLVVVSQGEINRTHSAMKDAIRRAESAEAKLAEARAQIAALRPAADAYRACVRWENASSYGTQEECAAAWTEYLEATRRAIAFIPGATL